MERGEERKRGRERDLEGEGREGRGREEREWERETW